MKALAVDSSASRLTVSARNESDTVTCVYDIGMRQSEVILTAIDYVLNKAALEHGVLDCAVLCAGPGSFTGLRLAFSALKAINLSCGTPVYAIPTLEAIAYPYRALPFVVLSVIDARKGRFYAAAYQHGKRIIADGDYTTEEIIRSLYKVGTCPPIHYTSTGSAPVTASTATVLACGEGAALFADRVASMSSAPSADYCIAALPTNVPTTDALFALASEHIANGIAPLRDFDGPVYLRPCDAEAHLLPASDANAGVN